MLCSTPVVDNKHHHLREGAEKVDQVSDVPVLIINTWEIDHIKVLNIWYAVEKGDCGTLLCYRTSLNIL